MTSQQVIFFGGQGSRRSPTAGTGKFEVQWSTALTLLLSACHSAFLEEVMTSRSRPDIPIWANFDVYTYPESLLNLQPAQARNPILEGVSLCTNQLLAYLNHNASLELQEHSVVAGFCSGMLAAVVVACSGSLEEYIKYSREAVRAAYWIGYRAAELSHNISGEEWQHLPWALSVIGKAQEKLEGEVEEFNQRAAMPRQEGGLIRVANRFGQQAFSVVGPGSSLERFRSKYLSRSTVTSLISVYALYHAGDQGHHALESVLRDLSIGKSEFPSFTDLKRPLRCCHNGCVLDASSSQFGSLLEHTLSCVLVESADLFTTWEGMTKSVKSDNEWEILTIGAGAQTLIASVNRDTPLPQRTKFTDLPYVGRKLDTAISGGFAVVGMSVNFPSGLGKEKFWKTLEQGLNTVREVPNTRFKIDEYQPGQGQYGKSREMRTCHGNFIANPHAFDHEFFNISPREAKSMDPQQKMLLQGAVHALDDAGYVPHSTPSYDPKTIACYIGIATEDYIQNLTQDIDLYYSTGTLRAFLSGKISYAFGWSGPSLVIDTACSSSMVSIASACRALAAGDCTAALAGGANVITSPDMYIGLSRAHFLSATGQCKPFDAGADGYCRSEGCGLFVIKRLEDAVSENDRIYGVIRGIELNQSGNASSITHPHSETQQDLFRTLLSSSGIDPVSVSVVEAHGTGTQAGDGAESSSLESVFGGLSDLQSVYLTSIKGNIGHAEAASGAASLAKILMMMRHATIPPQVGFKRVNPMLESLLSKNFHIATRALEWKTRNSSPRRALLNNFGAAGSNVALIVEEYHKNNDPHNTEHPTRVAYNFVLSAKSQVALKILVKLHLETLQTSHPTPAIEDLCYTVTARRQLHPWRVSLVTNTTTELTEQLSKDLIFNQCNQSIRSPIVFAFSGQGGFYVGMGKQLLSTAPVFREKVAECDLVLQQIGLSSVFPVIEGTFSPDSTDNFFIWSQIACFVVEYALASLWLSWNVQPDLIIGHSLGEFAAMAFSKALSVQDALRIVVHRAQLMVGSCELGKSGMIACDRGASYIEKEFLHVNDLLSLTIACDNSPTSCVVSGPVDGIDCLEGLLQARGIRCKRLDVPLGFHSAALDSILQSLNDLCQEAKFSAPQFPMGSCFHGRLMQQEDLNPTYIVRQTRGMVRFTELIKSLFEEGLQSPVFLEIGPHPVTLPMIKAVFSDPESLLLPSLTKGQDAWLTSSNALQQLSLRDTPICWRNVFKGSSAEIVDVPNYPFQTQTLFIPFSEVVNAPKHNQVARGIRPRTFHLLNEIFRENPTADPSKFLTDLAFLSKYILGHVVGKFPLCPASVYHGMVLEAAHWDENVDESRVLVTTNVTFGRPLLYTQQRQTTSITLTFEGGLPLINRVNEVPSSRKFTFTQGSASDSSGSSDGGNILCSGCASWQSNAEIKHTFARTAAYVKRQIAHLQSKQAHTNIFRTKALYYIVFPRVVSYSEEFWSIKELIVLENELEGYGTFQIPPESRQGGIVSPVFVDTLLHAAGFVANSQVPQSDACICTKVETTKVLYQEISFDQTFRLYCSLLDFNSDVLLGEAYAMTDDGLVVASVEGMHFKKLNLKSFQGHLERQMGYSKTCKDLSLVRSQEARPTRKIVVEFKATQQPQSINHGNSQATVIDVIAQICEQPRSSIERSSDLSSLGIDSMMRIELGESLREKFAHLDLNLQEIADMETIQQLQEYVKSREIGVDQYDNNPHAPAGSEGSSSGSFSDNADDLQSTLSSSYSSQILPASEAMDQLLQIISKTCEIPTSKIDSETTLESLGVDSLMVNELRDALQRHFGRPLKDGDALFDLNIQDLATYLGFNLTPKTPGTPGEPSQVRPDASVIDVFENGSSQSPLISPHERVLTQLQIASERLPPLVLFHDGSGTIEHYKKIGRIGSNVFAIKSSTLKEDHWEKSFTDMAHRYASAIAASVEGPVILGGWSFGGVLAHEVAQSLTRFGCKTIAVIMIDSPCPHDLEPLPQTVVRHMLSTKGLSPSTESIIAAQFKHHARLLAEYSSQGIISEGIIPNDRKYFMLHSADTLDTFRLYGADFPWLSDEQCREAALAQWERLLGRSLAVLRIPGNHFEPFEPQNVDVVSQQLQKAYQSVIT